MLSCALISQKLRQAAIYAKIWRRENAATANTWVLFIESWASTFLSFRFMSDSKTWNEIKNRAATFFVHELCFVSSSIEIPLLRLEFSKKIFLLSIFSSWFFWILLTRAPTPSPVSVFAFPAQKKRKKNKKNIIMKHHRIEFRKHGKFSDPRTNFPIQPFQFSLRWCFVVVIMTLIR